MKSLDTLTNTNRPHKSVKRVGRGPGSGKGKTCGRGEKGAGARSGYKRRWGYEGGQFRMFMKLPVRGFNNARFRITYDTINLGQIESMFEEGDTVNIESLINKGYFIKSENGIKVLAHGELTKQVKIEAHAISNNAREKLAKAKINFTLIEE